MHFTCSSYHVASQVKLSTVKKIHPEKDDWFLEAYSAMTNFRAKAMNPIAKVTNSFANGTNSIAKATNSIAKTCNSIITEVINFGDMYFVHCYCIIKVLLCVDRNSVTKL